MELVGSRQKPRRGRPRGAGVIGADGLTDRQRLIVRVIRRSVREKGYPPSLRQIAEVVGLSNVSSVHHHFGQLVAMGVICNDQHGPRSYRVADPTLQMCGFTARELEPMTDFAQQCADLGADVEIVASFKKMAEVMLASAREAQAERDLAW